MKKGLVELFWICLGWALLMTVFFLALRLFAAHVVHGTPTSAPSLRASMFIAFRGGAFFFAVTYGMSALLMWQSWRRPKGRGENGEFVRWRR